KRWLAAYRYYFNQCISYLHNNYDTQVRLIIDQKTSTEKEVKISAEELDKIAQKIDVPEWVKTLPGHQRQETCFEAFDAFKQARSQGGSAKFKSCKATSQTIQFKVGNFKNGTWYPRTCGNCGHVHHKLGGNKIFKCPHCGIQVYRDVNGARNILLRALQATNCL
ncbi:zinc ribbon domain-containing protein, partial [Anabaenopsis arnoldii]